MPSPSSSILACPRSCSARAAAFAAAMLTTAAQAGPPLATDDPETLPKGRFELNTAYTLTLSPRDGAAGRTWEHETPRFDLAYGFAEGVQLKFEFPVAVLDPAGGDSARAGIGDASFGSKLRLIDEDEWLVAVSIYPAVGIPLGDRGRGLGTGSPSLVFPVQIGRHFLDNKLWLYADAGYEEQFAESEADVWFTGLAAEYEVAEGLTLVGEVRWELGVRGAPDDSLFNLGVKWKLTEYASFIGAAGRSFNPTPDSGADLRLYLGVQWTF